MVATLITLVGLLGLLQAMNYAAQQNLNTQRRDEAVQIAEEYMVRFRSLPFAVISTCANCGPPGCSDGRYDYRPLAVESRMRGGGYTLLRSTTLAAGTDSADLGVKVSWRHKNYSTSHEVHSIRVP